MLRVRLLLLLAIAAPAHAAGWKLMFEDQFDGATLDRSKWATRYIYEHERLDHLPQEAEVYRDNNNHVLADGTLSLVARPIGGGHFESGMIRSLRTFYYGYFEARVFFPQGKGIWPAFWLVPDYDTNGKLNSPPEIDVFEYVINAHDDLPNMVHSAATVFPQGGTISYTYTDPSYNTHNRDYVATDALNNQWHIFGLAWAPDSISVFIDGRRLYTRAFQWVSRDGAPVGPAHVLLNFAVGGPWAGRDGIDETNFPQPFKIDYVRVCQMTGDDSGGRTCGRSKVTPDPKLFGYAPRLNDLAKPVIGASQASAENGGARVKVAITAPRDLTPDRTLVLSVQPSTMPDGRPVATATQPFTPDASGKFKADVMIKARLPLPSGAYVVQAAIKAPVANGGAQTPIVCADSRTTARALSCQIATLVIP